MYAFDGFLNLGKMLDNRKQETKRVWQGVREARGSEVRQHVHFGGGRSESVPQVHRLPAANCGNQRAEVLVDILCLSFVA